MRLPHEDWRTIADKVKAQVRRRVPTVDVDDVTQEALLRLYRGLPALRHEAALVGWASAVVGGAIADHHRAQRPVPEAPVEGEEERSVLATATPFVEPFVELIPEPYREAVRLVDLGQRRQSDVARALGVPVATLKSRVQRGRSLLRAELERCCRFEFDRTGVSDIEPLAVIHPRRRRQ